jgi:hypothetical protein
MVLELFGKRRTPRPPKTRPTASVFPPEYPSWLAVIWVDPQFGQQISEDGWPGDEFEKALFSM